MLFEAARPRELWPSEARGREAPQTFYVQPIPPVTRFGREAPVGQKRRERWPVGCGARRRFSGRWASRSHFSGKVVKGREWLSWGRGQKRASVELVSSVMTEFMGLDAVRAGIMMTK